jgi:hypothetical protein
MAVSNLILTALATNLFQDTVSANAAVVIKAATGTFYVIHVDNSLCAAPSFVKLWDLAAAVVVGTTVPDWVIKVPAAFKGNVLVATAGIVFTLGLQVATVTTGGTAGVASPAAAVVVSIAYT